MKKGTNPKQSSVVYECEKNCGFESKDIRRVEAHEKCCTCTATQYDDDFSDLSDEDTMINDPISEDDDKTQPMPGAVCRSTRSSKRLAAQYKMAPLNKNAKRLKLTKQVVTKQKNLRDFVVGDDLTQYSEVY